MTKYKVGGCVSDFRKSNKTDLLVIIIICLVSLSAYYLINHFLGTSSDLYAEIRLDGELSYPVNLSENVSFSIPEKPNVVFEVIDGAVAFVESDCPDGLCISTGFLRHNGQTAACLPSRLSLVMKSNSPPLQDGVDMISH